MNKTILIISLFAIIILSPNVLAGEISRSFDLNPTPTDNNVTVSIDVNIEQGEDYYIFDEVYPADMVITETDPRLSTEDPGHLKYIVISGATDTVFTYKGYFTTGGDRTFWGEYTINGQAIKDIRGETLLYVHETQGPDNEISIVCDEQYYTPNLWAPVDDWNTIDIKCNITNYADNAKNIKVGSVFDDYLGQQVSIKEFWIKERNEPTWNDLKNNLDQTPVSQRTEFLSSSNIRIPGNEITMIWVKVIVPPESSGKFDIMAGSYSLDPWWNISYGYRREYTFQGQGRDLTSIKPEDYPYGYPMNITLNTQTLIAAGKMDGYCRDLEVGINTTEGYFYPRFIRDCNTTDTEIWFPENWTGSNVSDYRTYYVFYGNDTATNIGADPYDIVYMWEDFEEVDDSINPYDINDTLWTNWYKRTGCQFTTPYLQVGAANSGQPQNHVANGRLYFDQSGCSGNSGAWLWRTDLDFNMSEDGLLVETEYEYSECCTCCDYSQHRSTTIRAVYKPDSNICTYFNCDSQHYGKINNRYWAWMLQSLSGYDYKWYAVLSSGASTSPGYYIYENQNLIPDSYSYAWWMGASYQGIKSENFIFNPDTDTFTFYSNYGSSNPWHDLSSYVSGSSTLSDSFFQSHLTYNNTIELGSSKGCNCGNVYGRYPYYFARPWQPDEPVLFSTLSEIPLDSGNLDLNFVSPTPANGSSIINETCTITINVSSNKTIDSCILDWDGTNESMSTNDLYCYATKTIPSPTTVTYKVYGEDIYGFDNVTGENTVTFALPGGFTMFSFDEPGDGATFTSYTNYSHGIDFNFTVVMQGAGVNGCAVYGNWTGTWHQNQTNQTVIANSTSTIINIPYIPYGNHIAAVGCWNDTETKYTSNITINVYGTPVTCSDCDDCQAKMDAAQVPTEVYLDSDISNRDGTCLSIRNNVTFDCQNHIIDGDNDANGYGISVPNSLLNSSIKNCIIQEFQYGLYRGASSTTYVLFNELDNLTIRYNTGGAINWNIDSGQSRAPFTNCNISYNPSGFYARTHSAYINFTNVNFTGSGSGTGIYFWWQGGTSRFFNVTVSNWATGFGTTDTTSTRWEDCEFHDNTYAIVFSNAQGNIFNRTKFYNNDYTVRYKTHAQGNQFMDSMFENATTAHIIQDSDDIGYHNYFNGSLQLGPNIIGGAYRGGNYWDTYTGWDTDGDGIGNSVYNLSEAFSLYESDYIDYLPLTNNLDIAGPNITIYLPDNSTVYASHDIPLNFTTEDQASGVDSCWYSLDGSNTTISGCSNTTITIPAGYSNITVYANDTAGLENYAEVLMVLADPYPPTLNLISPANTTYATSTINLNYAATDNVTDVDTCWYNLNDGGNITLADCSTQPSIAILIGQNNLTFWVNDTANHITTETVYFTYEVPSPGGSSTPIVCGNGVCDYPENYYSCPNDCKITDFGVCGNNLCEYPENSVSCPEDCANMPFEVEIEELPDPIAPGSKITCYANEQGCNISLYNPNIRPITVSLVALQMNDTSWQWITFSKQPVDLRPAQTQVIQLSGTVPNGTDDGLYEFYIRFSDSGKVEEYFVPYEVEVKETMSTLDQLGLWAKKNTPLLMVTLLLAGSGIIGLAYLSYQSHNKPKRKY